MTLEPLEDRRLLSCGDGEVGTIISANPSQFSGGAATTVEVTVQNRGEDDFTVIKRASRPPNWDIFPPETTVFLRNGEVSTARFTVTPPSDGGSGDIVWEFIDDDGLFDRCVLDDLRQSVSATSTFELDITSVQHSTVTYRPGDTINVTAFVVNSGDMASPSMSVSFKAVRTDNNVSFDLEGSARLNAIGGHNSGLGSGDLKIPLTASEGEYRVVATLGTRDRVPSNDVEASVFPFRVDANAAPIARPGGPYQADEGEGIVLDGSASSDPDGDSLTQYRWYIRERLIAQGVRPTVSWETLVSANAGDSGRYNVNLIVNDGSEDSPVASAELNIANVAPTITTLTLTGDLYEGSLLTFSAGASDPAGDRDPLKYEFDFDGDGSFDLDSGASPSATYAYCDDGTYRARVKVSDGDGGEDAKSVLEPLRIANVAPNVELGDDRKVVVGREEIVFPSVSDPGACDTHTYRWSVLTDNGAAVPPSTDKDFRFTPTRPGNYDLKLTVTDDDGGSHTDSVRLTADFDISPLHAEADAGFRYDENLNRMLANGEIRVGFVPEVGAAFQPLVTFVGSLWYDANNIHAEGTARANIGGVDLPLFSGVLDIPARETATRALSDDDAPNQFKIAGVEVGLTGLRLQRNEIGLQGFVRLPESVGGVEVGVDGANYVQISANGVSIPNWKATLPDIDIDVRGVLELHATGLSVEYASATIQEPGKLVLHGNVTVPQVYNFQADLEDPNYVQISEGRVDLRGRLSGGPVSLGKPPQAWTLESLWLEVDTRSGELKGGGKLEFPAGFSVDVALGFVGMQFDSIQVGIEGLSVPIGSTGLVLRSISGGVRDVADRQPPVDPVFQGGLGAGTLPRLDFPVISVPDWLGGSVGGPLVGLAVEGALDRSHFTMDGKIALLTGLARGTGNVDVNWAGGFIRGDANFDWLGGVLRSDSSFEVRYNSAWDITMRGGGSVHLPNAPDVSRFLKGQTLARGEGYLQFRENSSSTDDYGLAYGFIDLSLLGEKALGVKLDLTGKWEVLFGMREIERYLPDQAQPIAPQDGQFLVPQGIDQVMFCTSWLNAAQPNQVRFKLTSPSGDEYTERDFVPGSGVGKVDAFSDENNLAIGLINGVEPGRWRVQLAHVDDFPGDDSQLGPMDFLAFGSTTAPLVEVRNVVLADDNSVDIHYRADDDDSSAKVALYYDSDGEGFDGILIAEDIPEQDGEGVFHWESANVPASGGGYIYAVIQDENNALGYDYYDQSVGVGRVTGQVWRDIDRDAMLDQTERGLSGWIVFVDANSNGRLDAGERSTETNPDGSYELAGLPPGEHLLTTVARSGWESTHPGGPQPPADANGDFRVDLADFGPLKQYFGGSGGREVGDFNGDQLVNLSDFGLLKQHFGEQAPRAEHVVTVNPGFRLQVLDEISFGFFPNVPAKVEGILFHDRDANTDRDDTDLGLAGWMVFLDANGNAARDEGESWQLTEAGGRFSFLVAPDRYELRAERRKDWVFTTPPDPVHVLSLEPGDRRFLGFGVFPTRAEGGEFPVNSTLNGYQSIPQVAAAPDGSFVVTWDGGAGPGDTDGVFGQRYDIDGLPVGDEFRLNSYTADSQDSPDVAVDGDGDFVTTWSSFLQDGDGSGIYAQRFDALGRPLGIEFRVNSTVAKSQYFSRVASDVEGNFVIVWASQAADAGDIFARRYDAHGVPLGDEFQVNATTEGRQDQPDVAMNAQGDWVVVWQDRLTQQVLGRSYAGGTAHEEFVVDDVTLEQSNPKVSIAATGQFVVTWSNRYPAGGFGPYLRRYDSAGQAIDFQRVAVETTHVAAESDPAIALSPDGQAIVVWEERSGEQGHLWAQRFDSTGPDLVKLDGEHRVNPFGPGVRRGLAVAADSLGGYVIVWHHAEPDSGFGLTNVFARRYGFPVDHSSPLVAGVFTLNDRSLIANGDRLVSTVESLVVTFSEPLVASGPTDDVTTAALWSLWRGNQHIAGGVRSVEYGWNALTGHYEAELALDANGLQVGEPALSDGNYELRLEGILTDRAGNLLDGDSDGVPGGAFRRNFRIATPQPAADETLVNTQTANNQQQPQMAVWRDGSSVVVWKSEGQEPNQINGTFGIYGQLFDADGTRRSVEFPVNTVLEGSQDSPSVATADNLFVVVWSTPVEVETGLRWDIRGRLFMADGTAMGDEFPIHEPEPGYQPRCRVAMDHFGNFVVVWQSKGREGDDVFARRFNAAGTPLGDAFPVNATQSPLDRNPEVAMDASGNFVVVWSAVDGSALGVFGQLFDAGGNRFGPEFAVNSRRGGGQSAADVAMNASGRFVVTWQTTLTGELPVQSRYIAAQIFDLRGQKIGAEIVVNQQTPTNETDDLAGPPAVAVDDSGDFIVAWTLPSPPRNNEVRARRYNAAGVAQGGEFNVNRIRGNDQHRPSVGMDSDGDFIVAYESENDDGSGRSVWMRRFAAPATVLQPGDTDLDGDVDLTDFGNLKLGFGKTDARRMDGDLDDDRNVDLSDFGILKQYFGAQAFRSEPVATRPAPQVETLRAEELADLDWLLETQLDDELLDEIVGASLAVLA